MKTSSKLLFGTILFFGGIAFFTTDFSRANVSRFPFASIVSASDDDEEDEDEDEDDEDDSKSSEGNSSASLTTKEVVQEVVEYKPVTKQIVVTQAAYAKDSDEDGLVDAIDPNVSVKQSEYFTDTDKDGVPNALDKHHDEDDFTFFDDIETDDNQNGILDSYEQ